jgi:myosin-1
VNISGQIDYTRKLNKTAQIKFIKDDTVKRDDVYKSHCVHVPTGEPSTSVSDPPCPRKEPAPRPIKSGKLLRAGGPNHPSLSSGTKKPSAHASSTTSGAKRVVPPVPGATPVSPPPPPPTKVNPTYKALYDFNTQDEAELAFQKDDVLEIIQKETDGVDNGWWLAKKGGSEGWVPSNYLEEIQAPVPPPIPPARRPMPAPPAAPTTAVAPSIPPAPTAPPSGGAAKKFGGIAKASRTASVSAIPGLTTQNGGVTAGNVPAWKAELEARKATKV